MNVDPAAGRHARRSQPAAAASLEHEQRLRLFVEHAPVALAMFDRDMRYFYWSRRWLTDYKLDGRDLAGLRHYDVFPEIGEAWKSVHRRAQAGEVVRADEDRFDRIDGSVQWLRWEVRPWFDAAGAIGGIVVFSEDITERKVAQLALNDSLARYAALIETSPDAIFVNDGNTVALVNAAAVRLFGAERPEQLVGRHPLELFAPEYHDRIKERIGRLQQGELVPRLPERIVRLDGRQVDVEVVAAPFPQAGRHAIHVVLHDISGRLALEAQLRQAQRLEAVGRLAGGIAHDFNNLLTIIAGNTELLAARMPPGAELLALLDQVRDASQRAATLTQQLLAFSRAQVLAPQVVELNAVVARTESMLRRLIGEDVALTCALGEGAGCVRVDPGQLEQAIVNLAVNARDAMPDGGHLQVVTAARVLDSEFVAPRPGVTPGRYVELAVRDDGQGMTSDVAARVFDPFFTTKPVGRGTGLGLATVFGFVKQSGGHVEVESAPGAGTCVRVFLPHVTQASASEPVTSSRPSPAGDETILLVEDEPGVRKLAQQALDMLGYRVIVAESPEQALRVASTPGAAGMALLLTDLVMPGISGRQLAQVLRERHPGLGVLFMSGYVGDALERHGLGTDEAFLQKPFSLSDLATQVRAVLDGRLAE